MIAVALLVLLGFLLGIEAACFYGWYLKPRRERKAIEREQERGQKMHDDLEDQYLKLWDNYRADTARANDVFSFIMSAEDE